MAMLEVALGFAPTASGQTVAESAPESVAPEATGRNVPLAYEQGPVRVAEFDLKSGDLDNLDERRLETLAEALTAEPGLVGEIEVVGHADPSGPESLNNRLARERAVAVAGILEKYGIDDKALIVTSKGASEPIAQSMAPDDLAKSRRVELRFKNVSDQARLTEILNELYK
jgi:outer membrane protein OmpA-like peptidoglycan-associated protein